MATNSEITTALHRASRTLLHASRLMQDSTDQETIDKAKEVKGAVTIMENWIESIKNGQK